MTHYLGYNYMSAILYMWGIDKGQIGSTFEKVETYAMN